MRSRDPFQDPAFAAQEAARWAKQNRSTVGIAVVVALAAIGAWTAYYQVEAQEVGVILRFGKHIGNAEPGPHFKIPFGVDEVIKVPVGRSLKMEFGFRTVRADMQSEFDRDSQSQSEAEMLTGDRNVAITEWIVQYRIQSPEKYLFNFREIEATLRLMSEATMRAVIGDHSIDEALTVGREAIEIEAKEALAELNKRYDTGIVIMQVKLQEVDAPESVRPALREVEEAKQERERAVNDAWAEYNKVIPQARGAASQSLEAAEGYRVERVNQAEGDAGRFRALETEYRKAPKVTRTRLYLEALGEILPRAKHKVLVDSKTQGLVPLLNLASQGGKP
ncbi:MAG: FtsH protease activity modulator HflK [Myxococcota bacterium]